MRLFPSAAIAYAPLTLAAILICFAPATQAQDASLLQNWQAPLIHQQVLGFQDSQTGAFRPLTTIVPEPVTSPIAGTITLTLHITLKTAVPTGGKVLCGAALYASYSSASGTTSYSESDYVFGSVSGSTATCTLSIPHSWQFPAATTADVESLSGSYTAEIVNPTATSAAQISLARSSASGFVSLSGSNIFATAPSTFSMNVTL